MEPSPQEEAERFIHEWADALLERLARGRISWTTRWRLTEQGKLPEVVIKIGGKRVEAAGRTHLDAARKAIPKIEALLTDEDFTFASRFSRGRLR